MPREYLIARSMVWTVWEGQSWDVYVAVCRCLRGAVGWSPPPILPLQRPSPGQPGLMGELKRP